MKTKQEKKEIKRNLYSQQLWIREKIAIEAEAIAHICKGESRRGKIIADQWYDPIQQSKSILARISRMEKHLSELNVNLGCADMLKQIIEEGEE